MSAGYFESASFARRIRARLPVLLPARRALYFGHDIYVKKKFNREGQPKVRVWRQCQAIYST